MPKIQRVAVVVETHSEYGRAIIRGVASYAERGRNWELSATPLARSDLVVLEAASGADGVIALPSREEHEHVLRRATIPIVGVHYRGQCGIPRVMSNATKVSMMAADHFIAQGFRHFGFFGARNRPFSVERREAFIAYLAQLGFSCSCFDGARTQLTQFDWNTDPAEMNRWLQELPKPAGILAANDMAGQELLMSAQHANVRVPDEVAVVGVDNDELVCRLTYPPLSSVDGAGERIGFEAAALLDRMLHGEDLTSHTVSVDPARLVVRQSSDVLAISDPSVAEAVRFIRHNISEHLTVDDVLREIPIARRTLEVSFRRVLGRSILEEITASRIRRAKQLLIETDAPIEDITETCGFTNRTRFSTVFHQHTGHAPAQYRKLFRKPR